MLKALLNEIKTMNAEADFTLQVIQGVEEVKSLRQISQTVDIPVYQGKWNDSFSHEKICRFLARRFPKINFVWLTDNYDGRVGVSIYALEK